MGDTPIPPPTPAPDLPLDALTDQFRRLPGVGRKTALKYAMRVLSMTDEEAEAFSRGILEGKRAIHTCPRCFYYATGDLCSICADPARDAGLLCVVEDAGAVMAIERSRAYRGRYHVLQGLLSPLAGKGPGDLRVRELLSRIKSPEGGEPPVREVILATNSTAEGEATALYLVNLLRPLGVAVTRLAYGIPVGADLEYADEVTLARALSGRQNL